MENNILKQYSLAILRFFFEKDKDTYSHLFWAEFDKCEQDHHTRNIYTDLFWTEFDKCSVNNKKCEQDHGRNNYSHLFWTEFDKFS